MAGNYRVLAKWRHQPVTNDTRAIMTF